MRSNGIDESDGIAPTMIYFDGDEVAARLDFRSLIDRLGAAMRERPQILPRTRAADEQSRELLIMPAMLGDYAGIKALTVTPANRGSSRPVIAGLYTLFALPTGEVLATMDAGELTARRTSAISAAAAARLARPDAATLTVLGGGHLAPYLAVAHALVRPIRTIRLWARCREQAALVSAKILALAPDDFVARIEVVDDLEDAVRSADIVSAATSATEPFIPGAWLREGAHVDLVGSYRPDMRELDDAGIAKGRIFIDDRDAALREAGDLIDPISRGIISAEAICGDLAALCAGTAGRTSDDEITIFKAVGIGIADLVAAIEAWERPPGGQRVRP